MTPSPRRPLSPGLLLFLIALFTAFAAAHASGEPAYVIATAYGPALSTAVDVDDDDADNPASAALEAMFRMKQEMDDLTDVVLSGGTDLPNGDSIVAQSPDVDSVFDALLANVPSTSLSINDGSDSADAAAPRTVTQTRRGVTADGGEFETTTTTTTSAHGVSRSTSTVYSSSSLPTELPSGGHTSAILSRAGSRRIAIDDDRRASSRRHRTASVDVGSPSGTAASGAGVGGARRATARRAAEDASRARARAGADSPVAVGAVRPRRPLYVSDAAVGPTRQELTAAYQQASSAIEKLARQARLKQLEAGLEAMDVEPIEVDAKGRPWPKGSGHAVVTKKDAASHSTEAGKDGWEGGLPTDGEPAGPGALVAGGGFKAHLIGPDGKPLTNLKQITIDTPGDGKDIEDTIKATEERLGVHYNVRKVRHSYPRDHTHFHVEPDRLVAHGDHYHRQSETDRNAGWIMLYMMGAIFVSQLILWWWKSVSKRSFDITVLFGLWLTPVALACYMGFWRFIVAWLLFTAAVIRIVALAAAPKGGVMEPSTPRRIYQWFYNVHLICYTTAIVSAILLMLHLSGIPYMLGSSLFGPFEGFDAGINLGAEGSPAAAAKATAGAAVASSVNPLTSAPFLSFLWIGDIALHLIFYALYFGVLGRDVAAVVTDTIAAQIGYAPKELIPARKLLPRPLRKRIERAAAAAASSGLRMRGAVGINNNDDGDASDADDGSSVITSSLRDSSFGGDASDDGDGKLAAAPGAAGVTTVSAADASAAAEAAAAVVVEEGDEDKKPLLSGSSKSSAPVALASNTCAICDCALIPSPEAPSAASAVTSSLSSCLTTGLPAGSASGVEQGEPVYGLVCGHTFHESCLRGWLVVGKHDTCALCHEKCSVRETLAAEQPWALQDTAWSGLLDFIRMVIVFNPVIIFINWILILIY